MSKRTKETKEEGKARSLIIATTLNAKLNTKKNKEWSITEWNSFLSYWNADALNQEDATYWRKSKLYPTVLKLVKEDTEWKKLSDNDKLQKADEIFSKTVESVNTTLQATSNTDSVLKKEFEKDPISTQALIFPKLKTNLIMISIEIEEHQETQSKLNIKKAENQVSSTHTFNNPLLNNPIKSASQHKVIGGPGTGGPTIIKVPINKDQKVVPSQTKPNKKEAQKQAEPIIRYNVASEKIQMPDLRSEAKKQTSIKEYQILEKIAQEKFEAFSRDFSLQSDKDQESFVQREVLDEKALKKYFTARLASEQMRSFPSDVDHTIARLQQKVSLSEPFEKDLIDLNQDQSSQYPFKNQVLAKAKKAEPMLYKSEEDRSLTIGVLKNIPSNISLSEMLQCRDEMSDLEVESTKICSVLMEKIKSDKDDEPLLDSSQPSLIIIDDDSKREQDQTKYILSSIDTSLKTIDKDSSIIPTDRIFLKEKIIQSLKTSKDLLQGLSEEEKLKISQELKNKTFPAPYNSWQDRMLKTSLERAQLLSKIEQSSYDDIYKEKRKSVLDHLQTLNKKELNLLINDDTIQRFSESEVKNYFTEKNFPFDPNDISNVTDSLNNMIIREGNKEQDRRDELIKTYIASEVNLLLGQIEQNQNKNSNRFIELHFGKAGINDFPVKKSTTEFLKKNSIPNSYLDDILGTIRARVKQALEQQRKVELSQDHQIPGQDTVSSVTQKHKGPEVLTKTNIGQDTASSGVVIQNQQQKQQSHGTSTPQVSNLTSSSAQTDSSPKTHSAIQTSSNIPQSSQNSSTQISKKSDLSPFHASIKEHLADAKNSSEYEEGSKKVFTSENLTKCGMSTVKWSKKKDKIDSFTLDIAGGGSVDVTSSTKEVKIGDKNLPVRKVDLGPILKDTQGNNKGPADFSFALLNEDGTKSTNYFTLHYDKDGKLVDMSYPKDELHTCPEGTLYIEREGKKFTLPIDKSQYNSMKQAIDKNMHQIDRQEEQQAKDLESDSIQKTKKMIKTFESQGTPVTQTLPTTKPPSNSKSTGSGLQ